MTSYFISDLHLDAARPEITRAFVQFLQGEAQQAHELYILGDLFEAWIGDDDDAPLALEIQTALKTYVESGHKLYFMQGNRDFLVGNQFCRATGAQMLTDPTVIDLHGHVTVLMHGDTLCTDDVDYQNFRAQARNPEWQAPLLAQPLAARRQIAAKIRAETSSLAAMKAEDIMDVNREEVARVMLTHRAELLIHGHTHRPSRHPVNLNGQQVERIVLGDWHSHLWYLAVSDDSVELIKQPL